MKKTLATILAIVMLISLLPAFSVSAADPDNGVEFTKTLVQSVAGQPRKIKLEAYTTGSTASSQSTTPADIILVLDQSGSMDETINGQTKLQIMKEAVTAFADEVASFNTNKDNSYRLAIVGFASESGYDDNTEILTATRNEQVTAVEYHRITDITTLDTDNTYYIQSGDEYRQIRYFSSSWGSSAGWYTLQWGSFRDYSVDISNTAIYERVETVNTVPALGVSYNALEETHYENSFINCFKDPDDTLGTDDKITDAIAALDANGATRTDLGMNIADAIFDAQAPGTYDNRSKIVVVITDGVPTTQSAFSETVANSAVTAAKHMKDTGAHIFSMYLGTPSENSVSFLQALSSNYPDATEYDVLGDKAAESYYSAHTDASAVTKVFEDIAFSITANSTLNESSITTDIVSDYFRLPISSGTAYKPEVYTVEKTATGWATEEVPFPTATVTIENEKTVKVSGFNFAYHCVTTESKVLGGADFGRKLVVYIPIVEDENADTFGGYLPTNSGAAIYQDAQATTPTETAPSAKSDVTLKYSLADAEYWKHIETATSADFEYNAGTLNPLLDKMVLTDNIPDGENNLGVNMEYKLIDTNLTAGDGDDTVIATLTVPAGQSVDVTDFANWTLENPANAKKTLTFSSADDFSVEAMYALECKLTSTNAGAVAPYDTKTVYSLLDVEFVRHNVHIVGGVIDEGGTLSVASIPAEGALIGNTYRETVKVDGSTPKDSAEMVFAPKTGYEIAQIIKKTSSSHDTPLDTSEVLYDVSDGTNKVSYSGTGDFEYQFINVTQGMAIEVYTKLLDFELTTSHDAGSEIMRGTTYTYSENPLEVFFSADEGYKIASIKFGKTESAATTYAADELLAKTPAELTALGVNLETVLDHNANKIIVDGDVHVSRKQDNYVAVTSVKRSYNLAYKYYKQEADGTFTEIPADQENKVVAFGANLSDNLPTKAAGDQKTIGTDNYTLVGWYRTYNNEFAGLSDLAAMKMPAEDLTFHAYWEKNPDKPVTVPSGAIKKQLLAADGNNPYTASADLTFEFKAMFHEQDVGSGTVTVATGESENNAGAAITVQLTDFQYTRYQNGDPIYIYEVHGGDPTWIYDDVRYAIYHNGTIERTDGTAATEVIFVNQKAPYLVNYDLAGGNIGGNGTIHPKVVDYDDAGLLPTGTAQKAGHIFAGWKKDTTDVTDTTTYDSLAGGVAVTEITLVAQWTPNYTVKYDLAGGNIGGNTTLADKTQVGWDDADLLPAGTPVRSSHTFEGWFYDTTTLVSATTAYSALAPDPATVEITLVAKWTYAGGGGGGGGGVPKYTLTYDSNGGTEFEKEKYNQGTVVDISKVPQKEGYIFDGWHLDESFKEDVDKVKMTKNITVYAAWIKDDSSDKDPTDPIEPGKVPDSLNGDDHFAYVIGYPDGSVRPQGNITRAEVAAIFFRLLKANVRDENLTDKNSFADVAAEDWHNTAISTLAKLGIVEGRNGNSFYPDAVITRAEFASICARFDASAFTVVDNFTDVKNHWAEDEIHEAAAHGWIKGYEDGTFRPNRSITRAEAMTMINRVLNRMPETAADLLPDMIVWPDNSDKSAWYYLAVQEATNSHDFEKRDIYEKWIALREGTDWVKYQ